MRRTLGLAAFASGALILMAAPALAGLDSVSVGSFYYEDGSTGDGTITAKVGDQLKFVFSGKVQHSATVNGQFDSGVKKPGTTWTTGALMKAGTFTLYCSVHGVSRHSTTLVVTGTSVAPSPTPSPTSGGGGGGTSGGSTTTGGTTSGGGTTTGGTTTGGTVTATSSPKPSPSATSTSKSSTTTTLAKVKASPTPSLAPAGDGVADAKELAQAPAASGSLAQVLGRSPAAQGSWTRSIGQAAFMLIPMGAAAWWALRRRSAR